MRWDGSLLFRGCYWWCSKSAGDKITSGTRSVVFFGGDDWAQAGELLQHVEPERRAETEQGGGQEDARNLLPPGFGRPSELRHVERRNGENLAQRGGGLWRGGGGDG